MSAYQEVAEFIVATARPAEVAAFRPSEAARQRVLELIRKEKDGVLTADEASELAHCMSAEHLMRLAKAHAHRLLETQ